MFFSRGSLGRERNDKPLTLGPSKSGPPSLGGAGKETVEEQTQEDVNRDTHIPDTPKLQSSTASRSKLERSQSRESGKQLIWIYTNFLNSFSKINHIHTLIRARMFAVIAVECIRFICDDIMPPVWQ